MTRLKTALIVSVAWSLLPLAWLVYKCSIILIPEYLRSPPTSELYDMEKPYLTDPPLTDRARVSNENFSTVVLFNSSVITDGNFLCMALTGDSEAMRTRIKHTSIIGSTFKLGDTVALLITIRDGRARPKNRGGDELRVWLVDTANEGNRIAARVTDFDNGTYLATSVLAWEGTLRVRATLVYPREYIQIILMSHVLIKSMFIFIGGFVNIQKEASEATPCNHVPIVPGFQTSQICNLTADNGSPYYCGRPVKPQLNCSDYVYSRFIWDPILPPMTEDEVWLLRREKKVRHITGSLHVVVNVVRDNPVNEPRHLIPHVPCHKVQPRKTWDTSRPAGYFYNKQWLPLDCKMVTDVKQECFKNLQIFFLGDSNSRGHYDIISNITNCSSIIKRLYEAWHKPLICNNEQLNFTMKWLPHSSPFLNADTRWDFANWTVATNKAIDDIPSTGSYVVYLNHYLHFVATHVSAFRQMLVTIRDALKRLFARNPNVTVVLQGPHVIWWLANKTPYQLGDNINRFMVAVEMEVFRDMRNKIIYQPFEDLTVAEENDSLHPESALFLVQQLLDRVCGQRQDSKL